jgi:hypothetical protein
MQTDADAGVTLQMLEKRQVTTLEATLEDVIEIANGLMRVNQEYQMKFLRHLVTLLRCIAICHARGWHRRCAPACEQYSRIGLL